MKENEQIHMYEHEGMVLRFAETELGLRQLTFNTEGALQEPVQAVPFPNFELAVAGRPYGHMPALVAGMTQLPAEMKTERAERTADGLSFAYKHEELGLKVLVDMEFVPGAAVLTQRTTIVNEGDEPVTLTHLSSMCMQGIATDGCRPWHDRRKIRVHYCMQAWNGEGQWRSGDLEQLGLYPTSTHPSGSAIHIASVGSWSTGRYLPMAVVEDLETNKVWYFQIETSANWHFEIGHRGSWTDERGALYMQADGLDERYGGFAKKLEPGERFAAPAVAVGCCEGDFAAGVRELTTYRRRLLDRSGLSLTQTPVVYNDYMNTLWGNPSRETLLPLIEAASLAGCEYFCIDAGWFGRTGSSWANCLGDWQPSADRFDNAGLQGMLEAIRERGMKPGLWLEMEVCGEDAALAGRPDDWFIRRGGIRTGGGPRWFLNFEHPDVCRYMHDTIDRLVAMGVRYIKNDYNLCMGNGDDTGGRSAAEGLLSAMQAFYRFIDETRKWHPDLLFENCASGGMRADYGILSHFHLQSVSDQESMERYPSVVGGSLAAVLPEQLGVWAFPYPLRHADIGHPERLDTAEYAQAMQDGERTIFTMVNGLSGSLYLSGHLNKADARNFALVREAVDLYKRERAHIRTSYPCWPLGFTRINDRSAWAAIAHSSPDDTRVLLSVWRLGSDEPYADLPIPQGRGRPAEVRVLYPAEGFEIEFYYNPRKSCLTVHMTQMYRARLFEIRFNENERQH